ncbi:hypothetical protein HELRODRAFT_71154 [Helobdella robusta]|uniref:UBR-type domain-containing protein n=1 Tax=Helobdella robusta TaxID=6412 RepID=T1G0H1_HELRO|nr:hypothetical protein HELRODRAFT_71154 [Helobdella robusta]ESN90470.1 hypothetical protein HELRODRAFT_71154 [Helobdella robusta]
MSCVHFVVQSLPGSEEQFNDRLRDLSDKINKQGLQGPPITQNISISQVVVSSTHIAFLLQDGSICRVGYSVSSDRLNLNKVENKQSMKESNSFKNERSSRGIRIAESPLILIRGEDVGSMAEQSVGFASSTGNVSTRNNSSVATTARMSTSGRPRGRIVRAVGRGRGSGVIVGSRPLLPASVVPEDLVNQCQVVLQGKSRSLIVRELQKTNLDVNLAVNNLLSRDDEGDDDGDNCDSYMSGTLKNDLMSLLDAGLHSDHPSVIIDSESMFSEDMFGYSTMRARNSSRSRSDRDDRDAIFRLRERTRWLDSVREDNLIKMDRTDGLILPSENKKLFLNPINIGDELVYWRDKAGISFTQIDSMYSDLIAVNIQGQLCQWRWSDCDPYVHSENLSCLHSKSASLGLLGEKILLLSACDVRASVFTESGKVICTWVDESLGAISTKLDQPAFVCSEFQLDRVVSLHSCWLYTCARLESGALYWWGVMPYGQRKRNIEKLRSKNKKASKQHSTVETRGSGGVDIVIGSQVCLSSSPIYNIGALAFTVSNGVPKVGHLMKAAWDMEEMCRFKIKPASAPTQSQRFLLFFLSSTVDTAARNSSDTFKPDMPPPPSPASSTCSDHSGPSIVSPISLNRKRKQISTWTNEMDRKDEEDWHLKDVVFIEDVKIIPTGKVLKIDGNYVLVRFPSLSQSASKDQSMTGDAPGLLGKDDSVNMLMDTRILRKDELMIVKGTGAPKTPDYFQKIPKRINIGDNSKLLSITVDSQGLHILASAPTRIMYLYYNMNTCKMEQTCTFTVDPLSFMASSENDPTIYNCDEPNTPLLLRDGNGALYPMLKNCLNGIKDPLWYDMSPLRSLHMSSHFVHNYSTNLKTKIAIIALVNEAQMLMPAILKTDVEKVKNILQNIENKENAQDREKYIDMLLSERCDGNRNIIHACVAMCAPQSNKDNESGIDLWGRPPSSFICRINRNFFIFIMLSMHHARDAFERHHLASSSRGLRAMVNCSSSSLSSSSLTLPRSSSAAMEQRDGDDMLIPQFSWQSSDHNHHQDLLGNSSVMNMPRVTSSSTNFNLPSYLGQSHQPVRNEEKDRKFNALVILKVLCESPLLQVHLLDLLKAKNSEGLTAFMQCICNRAYTAGLYLLETCRRIAMKEGEVNREVLMSMLFPPQSNLDNSPIHILCCNDMCSFTWTGDEHINQDIFECRTCGLVGSLCCCTECARVCHKGHDCKLKKTSPTAYCDCWEKCKCRSLIAGNQSARLELLNQLLVDTDLVKLPNTRGENILMFLLQTVGRQLVEQRQYRPSRVRSSNHHARKSAASDMDTQMPEHNLEPPKFSRRALERLLDDWAAVKSMLLTGHKEKKNSCSSDVLYEDQMYLESQSGVNQVDKFVHCLIVKCTVEVSLKSFLMLDSLLATLIREITNDRIEGRKEEAKLVACKFIRSVVRIFVVLSSEMAPISNKKRQGMGSSPPTAKCKRVFQSLINISIEELCEVAEALISPVRMGVARPTAPFSLVASSNDAIQGSEELFSIETQPIRPTVDGQMPMSSADATETRSANRLSSSERVAQERDHAEEEMADGGPEMEVLEGDDNIDDHDDHHSEHSEHDVNHGDQEDGYDMELDMMNASDSDSEESTRSHADNASVQRSAITAATAGSDAGVGSLPYFSDDDEDSGDSSSQDDDSKAGDSADNDADVAGLLDEQIDRRNNNQGSHILQPPQTMQWALRPRDVPPSTTRASLSTAVATTTSGTSGIVYIDPSVLRRTSVNPAITMTVATNQDSTLSMSTTASQLARSFSIVIRQVSDLLMTLHDNQNVTPSLPLNLNITHQDVVDLHVYLECRLKSTWDWLVGIMDATEAQLRFGSVLTGSSSFMHPYKSAYSQRGGLAASSLNHPSQASISMNRTAMPTKPPTTSATNSFVDGNSARRDYLTYALSLMRAHSREHYNTLPSTDITSLKHVAYVLDALIYYMRSGNDMDNSIKDSMSVQSWLETDDNPDETAFDDYNTRSFLLESESMDNVSDVDDNKTGRKHPFFQRSDSTIFLGCTPPDSFNSPLSESLPLAEQPHLLHPYARKEDLFGMPRQMVNMSTFASDASNCCHHNHQWSFFNQMPTHLALSCRCFNSHSHSSSNVSSFNHSSANATSSSSNILKNSSASNASGQSLKSHTVTSANLTDARHLRNYCTFDRSANLMGCVVSAETLLGRWRLCLDLFGRVFCEDVGSEPGSIISEFGGFTVKEVRFKRDMERFRNSQQRDLSIEVERDRNNLLVQTFKQLNTHFNRRHQNAGPPLAVHRVKVTFRDEPGEGSGVARSFYTAFCHAVLSSDDLPCLDTIFQLCCVDLLQRLKSREKERRRLQQHQQNNQLNIGSQLNNSNDISQSTSDNSDQAGGNDSLSSQKKQLGEKLYPRIYALQPNLASKITGMLMDMGSSYLLNLLASDEQLKQRVSEIMEVIANQSRESAANDSLDGDIFNLTNSYKFCNKKNAASQIKKISVGDEESEVEDNRPLFWQPGKKGYYSPRPGRNTAERLNAYRNVGRIIGLCMLQNEICPLYLNRHVLKFLLGRKISWHDLAFFDPIMYESLRQLILDSESKDGSNMLINMDLTFSVECSADDGGDSYNLVPNGNDIEVNASNIHDYVRKYAHFRMVKMVSRALENMKRGVFDVIPRGSFDGLTSEDLRLLLNGIGDINTQSLINYTSFNDETGDRSEKVQRFKKWFWSTVEKMNPVERQDLVYFWMSSPALPASEEGFQPMPSVTVRPADDNHLPTANTCISRLYIPLYSSKVILKTKLLLAIKTKSFGFV